MDHFLQPLVTALPSYTKDSMDFIKTIKAIPQVEDARLLVTMNTESLYTNVPFDGDLAADKFFLEKRPECNSSTQCILDLITKVPTSNFFLYGNNFFHQISGVAMGSKMSPSLASLYVGVFELELYCNHQENPFIQYVSSWKRYLDDVFFFHLDKGQTILV